MEKSDAEKPLTYLQREVRKNNSFVFVSYSHRNDREVYDTLHRLYDLGVNYWYDAEFKFGDKWDSRAIEQLEKKDCVGAIVFVSNQTIISDACHKEVIKLIELNKELKNKTIIPVLIGYNEPMKAYEDTKKKIENKEFDDIIKNNNFYSIDEKIEAFKIITGDNTVISPSYSCDDYKWIDGLVESLSLLGVVEKQMFYLQNTFFTSKLDTKFDNSKNTYVLNLGSYPFDIDGNEEKIVWNAVWQEKNILTLVSEYVIDYDFKDNIENIIENVKNSFEKMDFIEYIGLIDKYQLEQYKEYIGKFITTDYADSKRGQLLKLNYIKCNESDKEYELVNVNGTKYEEVNKTSDNNYGVRLILKINIEKI